MTELAEAIYAVVEHDGTLFGYYSTQQFAEDAVREFAYDGMRVVKYVPQPTLTDAEREAIKWAIVAADLEKTETTGEFSAFVAERAATLRALLARLKLSENQNKRLEALQRLTELDEELGVYDRSLPKDCEIDGLKLICTCSACPEQYDVFDGDKQVGYLRLRHGWFRADCPDCGGETVHEAYPKGEGVFNNEDERVAHLTEAVKKIREWMAKNDSTV